MILELYTVNSSFNFIQIDNNSCFDHLNTSLVLGRIQE